MSLDAARARGAAALFGEKYGDTVRVVEMGAVSLELCGGTHLDNTAQVGAFHILREFSVASGVRRIEAVTGAEALAHFRKTEEALAEAAALYKARPEELREKLLAEQAELRALRRELEQRKAKDSHAGIDGLLAGAVSVGDALRVVAGKVEAGDAAALRQMGDFLRDKDPGIAAVLAAQMDGKLTFLAVCGAEAVQAGVKAGDLIRHVAGLCGGKGGGKADSAMGGGTQPENLEKALDAVVPFVAGIAKT
jgi:alanyl-tRNA synthetase